MASRPSWSTGCHACRRMKVKCDEAKPECARCKRAGRTCPGYRDAVEMRFRSMNATVAATAIVPTRATSVSRSDFPSPQLLIQPSTDWEEYAVVRFIDHFVEAPLNGAPGYLEFLPQMLKLHSSCLREAVLAAAIANLANVSCMRQLELASREHYGRALRALQVAMEHETTATADDTLTAIYILQKYQIISGTNALSSDPHEAAITAMFRLREATRAESCESLSLYRLTQMRTQIQALSGTPGRTVPDVDSNALQPSASGSEFWSLLQEASASSAQIQHTMLRSSVEGVPADALFNDTLLRVSSVYSRLLSWPNSVPERLKYKVLLLPLGPDSFKRTECMTKSFYLFNSIQHAAMWIGFWVGCIHLAQSLLQGYRMFFRRSSASSNSAAFASSVADIWERLLMTIGDICASAPYLLGDVNERGQLNIGGKTKALGGFFLLRALVVANSVEDLPIGLRRSLLDLLARIGTSVGIKNALRYKEGWLASHQAETDELSSQIDSLCV